jgi:hypothetical protein
VTSLEELVRLPHLSIVSRAGDTELALIRSVLDHKLLVADRCELETSLGRLLSARAAPTAKTLDLIGHSTPGTSLLMLGDWVIDAANPTVVAFFRELAEQEVLPRLGVTAVRLLGCLTADTGHARWTICELAEILDVEVYGTKDLIYSAHYDGAGFVDDRRYLLASSRDLSEGAVAPKPLARGEPYARVLDVDALPAEWLTGGQPWPQRLATADQARAILRLVRRRDGAAMPGLLAAPHCEVALPSPDPRRFHRAQVLLDCEFVRVYPEGSDRPGIVFPVDDPYSLKMLVDRLPVIDGVR